MYQSKHQRKSELHGRLVHTRRPRVPSADPVQGKGKIGDHKMAIIPIPIFSFPFLSSVLILINPLIHFPVFP